MVVSVEISRVLRLAPAVSGALRAPGDVSSSTCEEERCKPSGDLVVLSGFIERKNLLRLISILSLLKQFESM